MSVELSVCYCRGEGEIAGMKRDVEDCGLVEGRIEGDHDTVSCRERERDKSTPNWRLTVHTREWEGFPYLGDKTIGGQCAIVLNLGH